MGRATSIFPPFYLIQKSPPPRPPHHPCAESRMKKVRLPQECLALANASYSCFSLVLRTPFSVALLVVLCFLLFLLFLFPLFSLCLLFPPSYLSVSVLSPLPFLTSYTSLFYLSLIPHVFFLMLPCVVSFLYHPSSFLSLSSPPPPFLSLSFSSPHILPHPSLRLSAADLPASTGEQPALSISCSGSVDLLIASEN